MFPLKTSLFALAATSFLVALQATSQQQCDPLVPFAPPDGVVQPLDGGWTLQTGEPDSAGLLALPKLIAPHAQSSQAEWQAFWSTGSLLLSAPGSAEEDFASRLPRGTAPLRAREETHWSSMLTAETVEMALVEVDQVYFGPFPELRRLYVSEVELLVSPNPIESEETSFLSHSH